MAIDIGYILSFVLGLFVAIGIYSVFIIPILKKVYKSEWMKRALKSKAVDAWEAAHNVIVDEDIEERENKKAESRKIAIRNSQK